MNVDGIKKTGTYKGRGFWEGYASTLQVMYVLHLYYLCLECLYLYMNLGVCCLNWKLIFFPQIEEPRLMKTPKSPELALISMHNVNETVFFSHLPTIFRYYFPKFKYIHIYIILNIYTI